LDPHAFIFVTGLHRSGTSPLHRCLRDHPRISGFRNTGVAEDEGQHLQTVLPRNIGGPGRFGRRSEAHMTEEHPLANARTAAALLAQWSPHWDLSKPYLVEKSPPTLLRTRLFQALFPISSFVVIVRHPAAVALATFNALASAGWAQDLTVTDLIEHWLICHETFQGDIPYLKRLATVRYEELAVCPQRTVDAVYAFLGLPPHPLGEEIEPHVNARYLAQWRAMSQDSQHRRDIERAMHLEERVRGFGYSLRDWGASGRPSGLPIDEEAPRQAAGVKVLETERLILRRLTFDDLDELAALYADPETMRFLDGPRTRQQMWSEIAWCLADYDRTGRSFWATIHKADNRLVGRCGLLTQTIEGRDEAEVAYMIARPYWGQGLGTEAARAITEYAFANYPFRRLISLIDPENTASLRVAQKSGMHYVKDAEVDGLSFRIYAVNRPEEEPAL
jgi:RimJ/RimL family protein N-acetyltransferase